MILAVGCLLTAFTGRPGHAMMGSSLDEVLSCLETNGFLVDRPLAVRNGIEGILKSIDPGAILGVGSETNGYDFGMTQTVKTAESWPEDIAYVKIQGLTRGSGREILTHLQSLTGKAGIILDLRGVSGNDPGVVSCLAGIAHSKSEPLFILTDNQGRCLSTNVAESVASISTPLMVLIDGRTGRAAEALAALWRGHPGIMLIGSTTSGEVRFRDVVTLPNGQVITLATRKLVPMVGQSYEGHGVTPDVIVSRSVEAGNARLFDTNAPTRSLSAKSERDRDLMRRVDGDAVLQRATDIILGLKTLGGHGQ